MHGGESRAGDSVLSPWRMLASPLGAENWPQWRGPTLNGLSGETNLPVKWSTTENVAWKLAVPQWSGSTPIVWGEHIFLNVAEGRRCTCGRSIATPARRGGSGCCRAATAAR